MNWWLLIAIIPLAWRVAINTLPSHWIESYAYWDPKDLNTPRPDGRLPTWRNMGYWETGKETFSEANEALARRVLELAKPKHNDLVMDIAHGSGESLLIHLEYKPKHLVALASMPSDTAAAKALYAEHKGNDTTIVWYTGNAAFRPNKDFDHPLHPMRGFTGGLPQAHSQQAAFDVDVDILDEDEYDEFDENAPLKADIPDGAQPQPYDLITILDAIYHFPPSRLVFLASVLPTLRPGGGVVAFTDFIAPPSFSSFPNVLISRLISAFFHVPLRNLTQKVATPEEYKASLEALGYKNVEVLDWSDHVWRSFGRNLKTRKGVWPVVGSAAEAAADSGWKYIAVRAERP